MNSNFFLSDNQKPSEAQTIVPTAAALLCSVVMGLLLMFVLLFIYFFLAPLLV